MTADRIVKLSVRGFRCLDNIELDLNGLQVLIGDNGSGKSTVVEALELLHQLAMLSRGSFVDYFQSRHGQIADAISFGHPGVRFQVGLEDPEPAIARLEYSISLAVIGVNPEIVAEELRCFDAHGNAQQLGFEREGRSLGYYDARLEKFVKEADPNTFEQNLGSGTSALHCIPKSSQPQLKRLLRALENIAVHVPFQTMRNWLAPELRSQVSLRRPVQVDSATTLSRFGENLTTMLYALNQDRAKWRDVLADLQLGLGPHIVDVKFPAAGGGYVAAKLVDKRFPDRLVGLERLSDGQLAFICFLALTAAAEHHSLIVFDEPELHLHPSLLVNVLHRLEGVAQATPVLLATHSDRLLDALEDPAKQVQLCELDERGATVLKRANAEALAEWLQRYKGIGTLRAEGLEPHVFDAEGGAQ